MKTAKYYFVTILFIGLMAMESDAADLNYGLRSYAIEFDKYIDENIAPHVPGAALMIVADGKVQLVNSYGVREISSENPVTPETVFRLASVSKTFASSAIGVLVEDKVLDWENPVKSQLDHINFKNEIYGQQITLQNLLSHSTGLMPHAYTNLIEDNVPFEKIIKRLKDVDFICAPGKCYSYQNFVFSLSANIIESYTGMSYEAFVYKNLFAPLEMRNASFGLESLLTEENHAVPHVKKNGEWAPVKVTQNYYNIAPAAGVNASILDMGEWLLAQLGHRQEVLSEFILDSLHKRITKTSHSQAHYRKRESMGEAHYGLGWRIFDYGNFKDVVHHGGWVRGFRAEIVLNRNLQIGMAFLTNSEAQDVNDLVFKFLDIYENDIKMLNGPETANNNSPVIPNPLLPNN